MLFEFLFSSPLQMKNLGQISLLHKTNQNHNHLNLRMAQSTLSICSARVLPLLTQSQLSVRGLRQERNHLTFVSFHHHENAFFVNVSASY